MKALTLWQPWASAIALGAKRIETRSWSTRYRGPLLIHAARTTVGLRHVREHSGLWRGVLGIGERRLARTDFAALPFGAIVARAELVDCVPTVCSRTPLDVCRDLRLRVGAYELDLGDFSEGRYGLILASVEPLEEPIPFLGRQGMFNVPDGVLENPNPAEPPVEAMR